jgi:hypothetical protein
LSSPPKLRFEILKLVEYIPITGSLPSNGRFAKNVTIDSMFYFESLQRKGSFRDIVRVINMDLAKIGYVNPSPILAKNAASPGKIDKTVNSINSSGE